jgi:hypothetical protein
MKVREGRVQRKNRWARTPNYLTHDMPTLVIDRKNPGPGYRHLATKEELRRFLALLPNWEELPRPGRHRSGSWRSGLHGMASAGSCRAVRMGSLNRVGELHTLILQSTS